MGQAQATIPAVRLLLKYLEQEGVEHVFGIPGGPIISLYEALFDRARIRPVLAKHEEGAAFMADAYARVSGRIGVCCTTTGPGATNALTGVAVAYADHVPLLLITAQVSTRHFGRGAFQESSPEHVDIVSMFKPVTKWSTLIAHPDNVGHTLRMALKLLKTGRPGPVHVSLPSNFAAQPVPDVVDDRERPAFGGAAFDRAAVKVASRRLLEAERPVILAGHGINLGRAWGPLRGLAERFGIPVATTFKAKGAFPEDHPLSLGVFSATSEARVRDAVAGPGCDVLLVVGSGLGEMSSGGWDARLAGKRALLQADVDPAQIGRNFPVDAALTGDAAAVLTELRYQMERDSARLPPRARALWSSAAGSPACPEPPEDDEAGGPLKPRRILRELREALPRDAIVFVDNGSIRPWAGSHFPVYQEGCFFVNMGLGSMGYAVAGAVGGQLARPDRAVVALSGDAAFAMNGMEVHTAVEQGAPVIWVVVNNGGHGMIYHGERLLYGGKFASSLFRSRLDVARIARGLGAAALSARRPGELSQALARALALRRPCVIDVAADLHEAPPLAGRVASLRRELAGA